MNTAEKIAVMQHYEDGGRIECAERGTGDWDLLVGPPTWHWGVTDYRVYEEPKEIYVQLHSDGSVLLASCAPFINMTHKFIEEKECELPVMCFNCANEKEHCRCSEFDDVPF